MNGGRPDCAAWANLALCAQRNCPLNSVSASPNQSVLSFICQSPLVKFSVSGQARCLAPLPERGAVKPSQPIASKIKQRFSIAPRGVLVRVLQQGRWTPSRTADCACE